MLYTSPIHQCSTSRQSARDVKAHGGRLVHSVVQEELANLHEETEMNEVRRGKGRLFVPFTVQAESGDCFRGSLIETKYST